MDNRFKYWASLHGLTTLILVGVALYFLLVEHGRHTLPLLPYLIILLCPLMHVFMHKGHNHSGHQATSSTNSRAIEEAYKRGLNEGRKQSTTTR